jgi:hypothetical protein
MSFVRKDSIAKRLVPSAILVQARQPLAPRVWAQAFSSVINFKIEQNQQELDRQRQEIEELKRKSEYY